MKIEITEENFFRKNQFPQLLIPYYNDSYVCDIEDRVVLYIGRYSHTQ